jgi:predicted transcriptional regulator
MNWAQTARRQLDVMYTLYEHGPLTSRELRQITGIGKNDLYYVLRLLQEDDLILHPDKGIYELNMHPHN